MPTLTEAINTAEATQQQQNLADRILERATLASARDANANEGAQLAAQTREDTAVIAANTALDALSAAALAAKRPPPAPPEQ